MIHRCIFFCLVLVVHESLVCPEQFNCPTNRTNSLVSQHFCVFEPFPTMTVWFWDPSSHTEANEGLICSYYWRFKHSLMLQKEKTCIKSQGVKTFEQNEDVCIFLVLPTYHIFSFSTALQKLQTIVTCFTGDKLSKMYLDLQIQNVFMHGFSFWSISERLNVL